MEREDYIKALKEKEYWSKTLDYQFISTFWEEFCISDRYGSEGVLDHYKEVFDEWKDNHKYLTELVLILNLKIWSWYGVDDDLGMTYDKLWKMTDSYALDTLKGDKLSYYLAILD